MRNVIAGVFLKLEWPYVEGEASAMGEAFTRANKYVLTRGNQPLEWANSHRLKSIDDVAALKQGEGERHCHRDL